MKINWKNTLTTRVMYNYLNQDQINYEYFLEISKWGNKGKSALSKRAKEFVENMNASVVSGQIAITATFLFLVFFVASDWISFCFLLLLPFNIYFYNVGINGLKKEILKIKSNIDEQYNNKVRQNLGINIPTSRDTLLKEYIKKKLLK